MIDLTRLPEALREALREAKVSTKTMHEITVPVDCEAELRRMIAVNRGTGCLVIPYYQGSARGEAKWQEGPRLPPRLDWI